MGSKPAVPSEIPTSTLLADDMAARIGSGPLLIAIQATKRRIRHVAVGRLEDGVLGRLAVDSDNGKSGPDADEPASLPGATDPTT